MSTNRNISQSRIFLVLLLCVMMISGGLSPKQTLAATLTVNTLADENDGSCSDGDCSLRDAIQVADVGDTINFSVSGTIVLNLGPLFIDKNLTINGPGPDSLTVDGNHASQIFRVTAGSTAFIGLTIANGFATGVINSGGGMYNSGTTLLMNVTFSGSFAQHGGGGLYNHYGNATLANVIFNTNSTDVYGGGIYNTGTATLTNVVFNGNFATPSSYDGNGGGMHNAGIAMLTDVVFVGNSAPKNGGMFNGIPGTATLTNVTFLSNSAKYHGGGMTNTNIATLMNVNFMDNSAINLSGGGMITEYPGTSTLTNVTFSGNSANDQGAGMINLGTSTLLNVTFSGNTAGNRGGGLYNSSESTLTLTNVSLSGNSAGGAGGGGIYNFGTLVILKNTLLAGGDGPNGPDCFGTFSSYGYNLIQNTSGCTITGDQTGNIYGENPMLGPLGYHGGYTPTHALLAGSPAIDAASSTDPDGHPVTVDQRGMPRPQGAANDIGSFEYVILVNFWLPVMIK